MLLQSNRSQLVVAALLVVLLMATRAQHFASLHSLPGASWAVFFLAGIYLRPTWVLPVLLALVWTLDFSPYLLGGTGWVDALRGGQAFCLTPAYLFLLPAYTALWLAGRWYVGHHQLNWRTLYPLSAATLAGAIVCELCSSGSFYFFSGHFAEPTLSEFGTRLLTYFPRYLQSLALYVGTAAMLHALFAWLGKHFEYRTVARQ